MKIYRTKELESRGINSLVQIRSVMILEDDNPDQVENYVESEHGDSSPAKYEQAWGLQS